MTHLSRTALFALWLLAALCTSGCTDSGHVFSQYTTLPQEGWCHSDTLLFGGSPADSLSVGMAEIGIRHSADYPYDCLWLEISQQQPGRRFAERDTVCFPLTNASGAWSGRGIGTSFQMALPAGSRIYSARYPIAVRHIMRTDTLRGISQIGVFLRQPTLH